MEDRFSGLPQHVSIIMDGNGRWAKQRSLPRFKGHYEGVESVRSIVEDCCELGIPYLSLFAFSEENWARPEDEVSRLMELMGSAMLAEEKNFMKHGVRFVVIGNRERLPLKLVSSHRGNMRGTDRGSSPELRYLLQNPRPKHRLD